MTMKTVKHAPTPENVEQPEVHVTGGPGPIRLGRLIGYLQAQAAMMKVRELETAIVVGINKSEFGIWKQVEVTPFVVLQQMATATQEWLGRYANDELITASELAELRDQLAAIRQDDPAPAELLEARAAK